jgi:hypothetical protein
MYPHVRRISRFNCCLCVTMRMRATCHMRVRIPGYQYTGWFARWSQPRASIVGVRFIRLITWLSYEYLIERILGCTQTCLGSILSPEFWRSLLIDYIQSLSISVEFYTTRCRELSLCRVVNHRFSIRLKRKHSASMKLSTGCYQNMPKCYFPDSHAESFGKDTSAER